MGYIKEKDGVVYHVVRRKLSKKEELLLSKHIALEKRNENKLLKGKIDKKVSVKETSVKRKSRY
jgi:hypothetical protein